MTIKVGQAFGIAVKMMGWDPHIVNQAPHSSYWIMCTLVGSK